jgi:hypothetical protein
MVLGRKTVTVDGETYEYDPFRYLVLNNHPNSQAAILEVTAARPFLCGTSAAGDRWG